MSSYTTGKILDDYNNNNTQLDLYNKIQEEEYDYYQDDEIIPYYFPEKLCVFIDNTFYSSYSTSKYFDVLKFLSLYNNHIYNDNFNCYTDTISDDEFYYIVDCIQAFIDSYFGQLPLELIAYILIGKNNYIKFLTI